MTTRERLHRWWVLSCVIFTLSAAAYRHTRRARYRRQARRRMEMWPW